MDIKVLRRVISIILKTLAVILSVFVVFLCVTGVSPVYRFVPAEPFSGPDIFNPYAALEGRGVCSGCCDSTEICGYPLRCDSTEIYGGIPWKRANFHTHTKVDSWRNECSMYPQETWDSLKSYGYDIVTFSNHNELTRHPFDSTLQVNVYEHGYNFFKYHLLVFGSDRAKQWDVMLPLFTFQKQFLLDWLGRDSDFIQMNHPFRTNGTSRKEMESLGGYRIMELDSGKTTEQEYWDWALSAGRYSFALANDDLHYPDRHWKIARRCNFLFTPSGRYEDLQETLLGGCYYSMRVPDFGDGDWKVKHERNRHLAYVKNIGLRDGNELFITVSTVADSIKVTGQDGRRLAIATACDSLEYTFGPEDCYARFTAYFPDGEVIYSNPFARYDASAATTPYKEFVHPVNITLTILYNMLLLLVCLSASFIVRRMTKKTKK